VANFPLASRFAGPRFSVVQTKKNSYNIARLQYEIIWAPEAIEDWRKLKASDRTIVKDASTTHLRYEPGKVSKSRIKRLRKMAHPQYRLRVDEFRVFYDVTESNVNILAVVSKSHSASWLDSKGEKEE